MKLTKAQQKFLIKTKSEHTWEDTITLFEGRYHPIPSERTLRRAYAKITGSKSTPKTNKPVKHFLIGDVQARPGLTYPHLHAAGKLIVAERPDVVINIGDFGDFPSLSSWDKGKAAGENRRFQHDLEAMFEASDVLLAPLKRLQLQQSERGEEVYKPKLIWTLGNHEARVFTYENNNPEMGGMLSAKILGHCDWDVYPFLTPVVVDGVTYIHFLPNPMTGKPYGGSTDNMLGKAGYSFVQGHRQCWSHARKDLTNGQVLNAVICGAFYQHDEDYKGVGGNRHFRGCAMFHDVKDGNFDVEQISINRLLREYS